MLFRSTGSNTFSGGMSVTGGTLVLGNADALAGGAVSVATGAVARAQANLPKAVTVTTVTTTGTGKLDVTNNAMVIRGSTPAAVIAQITSGFNGGAWNGAGINSSTAAADANGVTAIGYAANSDYGAGSFKGVNGLVGSDVLVRFTYYGDADLSGDVTLDDFTQFLYGYQNQGAPLGALEAAIASANLGPAERAMMLAAGQAVPEPAGAAVLGIAAVGAGLRRKRRRRRA